MNTSFLIFVAVPIVIWSISYLFVFLVNKKKKELINQSPRIPIITSKNIEHAFYQVNSDEIWIASQAYPTNEEESELIYLGPL